MKRTLIREIYADKEAFGGKEITVGGWVRNLRDSKAFGFIDLNDGSYFKSDRHHNRLPRRDRRGL